MPQEISIQIPGLRLAARAWGPETGDPVMALHGWLDNAATFDRLAPLLPSSLRIVSLDLPGHGLSDHRGPDALHHYVDWVPTVFDAADALGWSQFSLLGHSMGGGIASLMAGTWPDRIRRAVLIEGVGPFTNPPHEAPKRLRASIEQRRKLASRRPRVCANRVAAARARVQHGYGTLSRAAADILVARGTEQIDDGVRWRHDLRLQTSSAIRLTEAQVEAFLRGIRCPVLVVFADSDWRPPGDLYRKRLPLIADCQCIECPGSHHLHLDTPEQVASPIGRFLTRSV